MSNKILKNPDLYDNQGIHFIRAGARIFRHIFLRELSKGSNPGKNSASIWTLSKGGGGGQPESKLFEALFFCLDLDLKPKLLMNFFGLNFDIMKK